MRSVLVLSYFSILLLAGVFTFKRPVTSLTASSNKMLAQEQKTDKQEENTTTTNINTSATDLNDGIPGDDNAVENPFEDIIDIPEAPTTEAYAPTALKDIPVADPSKAMSLISAPTANSSGNAVLNFAMKLPRGRLGMEPDLEVQYNNEGGHSEKPWEEVLLHKVP